MNFNSLLEKIEVRYKSQSPFVAFSLPNSEEVVLWSYDDEIAITNSFSKKPGFVFAPFNNESDLFYILKDSATVSTANIKTSEVDKTPVETPTIPADKKHHLKLVSNALDMINDETASKIVVSRKKNIPLKFPDIRTIFNNILNAYPTAFRYMWYHPETNLWCGASPELLLKTKGEELTTTSLAGTQRINRLTKTVWTAKEKNEQELVTKDLIQRLSKFTEEVKPSATYTFEAGSLAHIRTDIKATIKKSTVNHQKITNTLHPTPAVCGTPREVARQFILNKEGYNRQFYTGFLGIKSHFENVSEFYVNLRCMQIVGEKACIYVGGGITSNSQPELEWEETQNKLQTMLQVLRPFL